MRYGLPFASISAGSSYEVFDGSWSQGLADLLLKFEDHCVNPVQEDEDANPDTARLPH